MLSATTSGREGTGVRIPRRSQNPPCGCSISFSPNQLRWQTHHFGSCEGENPYGLKARDDELKELRAKVEPGRFLALNKAALKLGHLVASGHLDERRLLKVLPMPGSPPASPQLK